MTKTHRQRHTSLWHRWAQMKQRCSNPKNISFKHYGGRGIKVCLDWLSFQAFFDWANANGYREDLTLERVDVNGDYCPENCIWADALTQARNKRRTLTTTDGRYGLTVARENGIPDGIYYSRIVDRWTVDEAATLPLGTGRGHRGVPAKYFMSDGRAAARVAEENGIGHSTFSLRLNRGWSVEDAVTVPIGSVSKNSYIMSDGRRAAVVARTNGVPLGTMGARIRRGWSVDDAATVPIAQAEKFLLSDGRLGLEVAKEHGITPALFYKRVNSGWCVDAASTTPKTSQKPRPE